MLLQSLLVIATTVVLAITVLLSALVSAKTSLHQEATRKAETAAADGTAAFVAWAQSIMAKNALTNSNDWPTKPPAPIREELCAPGTLPPGGKCAFVATIDWTVTGKSTLHVSNSYWKATSELTNASVTLNEQRISATLRTTLSNVSSREDVPYAVRSRRVTARTFDAPPYVVITGSRDEGAQVADISSSEGDSGGYQNEVARDGVLNDSSKPTSQHPSAYTDTVLIALATCSNSRLVELAPTAAPPDLKPIRDYGNADWRFEAPCVPRVKVSKNLPYPSWTAPPTRGFTTQDQDDRRWNKNDDNVSGFAL